MMADSVGHVGDSRHLTEQRLYRREAIDFHRYQYIGETLRAGSVSLTSVGLAIVLLLLCSAALLAAQHRPLIFGHIDRIAGTSVVVVLEGRRASARVRAETAATFAFASAPQKMLDARIVDSWVGPDGRDRVRLTIPTIRTHVPAARSQRVLISLPARRVAAL